MDLLSELRALGHGGGIDWLLSGRQSVALPLEHPCSELVGDVVTIDSSVPERLLMLDKALATVHDRHAKHDWCREMVAHSWGNDARQARSALSELEVFGTLLGVFPDCMPVPRDRRKQTPDFRVDDGVNIEVCCPRESEQNQGVVREELASQDGPVRLAISHPITGSSPNAIRYSANKVGDRLLNSKRESKQTATGESNVLVLNVRHEWRLSAADLLPVRTKYAKGVLWVGTFGVWHAFFGGAGRYTMLGDRVAVEYVMLGDRFAQRVDGFFREKSRWSAAMILVTDGAVLFENPWAEHALSEGHLRSLLRMHRCRLDFCWHRGGGRLEEFQGEVERELCRLEWLFSVSRG